MAGTSSIHSGEYGVFPRAVFLFGAHSDRSGLARLVASPGTRALIVAIAYYAGAWVGFAFTAPDAPQSVMWLPNSILLAALLMSPTERWPLWLGAALPAHLLVAWQAGAPMTPMSLLFVTNCTDAFLGAAIVRLASRGRWRLDSFRNLVAFFIAAAIAPLAVSFLDATITMLTGWSTNFWHAYQTRVRANTLTNVILVPGIVGLFGCRALDWRRMPARRYAELAVLGLSLIALSAVVFSRQGWSGLMPTLLYLPLPILLWAAVRFGPGVTGMSLFVVAVFASWHAVRGVGAFAGQDVTRNIVAVQTFLFCVSVPLLCLAAVALERQHTAQDLARSETAFRLSVEQVRDLAGRLITAQEEERAHVARELHDGVSQQVAALALSLNAMTRESAAEARAIHAQFQRVHAQTSELFESVRELSHRLHPAVLRHGGLVAAMRSLCETCGQEGVPVKFDFDAVEPVPDAAALCLYRITQEALRNVSEHAGARSVRVALRRDDVGVSLAITDDGHGFDVAAERSKKGLGLVSMEERVRLNRGRMSLQSDAGGTRIDVHIPLDLAV
jgi:two-component system sensor histidine kinase UhpB